MLSAPPHVVSLRPLSRRALSGRRAAFGAVTPSYDRTRLRAGIAHIGVGNFHRVHQAVYIERCLHLPGHEDWAIVGIGLGDGDAARAKKDAFQRQDGLYSVTEFGADGSASARVVGAMIDYLHAPADPEAVLARLADPAIRIVSLTITEGGYNLDEASGAFMLDTPDVAADLDGAPPRTAFGFIVEALRRRRAGGIAPFTVLSCDNLRGNGDTARRAVLGYAHARDAGLAAWIAVKVAFPNSMVDRIAPGISDEERLRLNGGSGYADLLPAAAEAYCHWVLEDRFPAGRPDFAAAGVALGADVSAWEAMKGRLLNASHMMLSYPAILLGYRHVHEAMDDPLLALLLRQFMDIDVIPRLDAPDGVSPQDYRDEVLRRFGNAAVADQLLRVAHDGAAKIPVFYKATMAGVLADGDVRRIAFLMACFDQYLAGADYDGNTFAVVEPGLSNAERASLRPGDPLAVLSLAPFRALGLAGHPQLVPACLALAGSMRRRGVRATLAELLA